MPEQPCKSARYLIEKLFMEEDEPEWSQFVYAKRLHAAGLGEAEEKLRLAVEHPMKLTAAKGSMVIEVVSHALVLMALSALTGEPSPE